MRKQIMLFHCGHDLLKSPPFLNRTTYWTTISLVSKVETQLRLPCNYL